MKNSPAEPKPRDVPRQCTQVKICGLTRVEDAIACASLGADAVGLVFYPPSPRFVSDEVAREICMGLPGQVWGVGVFVNEPYSAVMRRVEKCRLKAVQLHGAEPPDLVSMLRGAGVVVIKTLFINGHPPVGEVSAYSASAYLVEAGGGRLPGGNAAAWDWKSVRGIFGEQPCILAGGLDSNNVAAAIAETAPDAVDVSSGVESSPGRKDTAKITSFLDAVRRAGPTAAGREGVPRRIFQ